MNEEIAKLIHAARQVLAGETLLGSNFLPAPAVAPAAFAPTAVSPHSQIAAPLARSRQSGSAQPAPQAQPPDAIPPPAPYHDLPALTAEQKVKAFEELTANAAKCLACLLAKTRSNLVMGEGDPDAQLVFVGEAPGEEEDKTGRPFVGRAGQKLTDMIQAMGLRREDVYICNILKCRPPGNRPPAPEEVQACWGFLVRQLQIIRPKVIVTLGNPATQNLLSTRVGITKLRGQWQQLPDIGPGLAGIPVMPTFHPSYVIRTYTPQVRQMVWSDLQKVMQLLGLKGRK